MTSFADYKNTIKTSSDFINNDKEILNYLFVSYKKPRGKKEIIANFEDPQDFYIYSKVSYKTTDSLDETYKIYNEIKTKYPELDNDNLLKWFINLESLQNHTITKTILKEFLLNKKIDTNNLLTNPNENISEYISSFDIEKDFDYLLYLIPNNKDLTDFIITQEDRNKYCLKRIESNFELDTPLLQKLKPKFSIKFLEKYFSQYITTTHYNIFKNCLSDGEKEVYLPFIQKEIDNIIHFITHEDFKKYFKNNCEMNKELWLHYSFTVIDNRESDFAFEILNEIKKSLDYDQKHAIFVRICNRFSKESENQIIKNSMKLLFD